MAHRLKRNDTSPALLYKIEPVTVSLAGATAVFSMKDENGSVKVDDAPAVIVDAGTGDETGTPAVKYEWDPADTNTAGTFLGEFRFTLSDGNVETFPNTSWIPIVIMEDI